MRGIEGWMMARQTEAREFFVQTHTHTHTHTRRKRNMSQSLGKLDTGYAYIKDVRGELAFRRNTTL